jgi:hypothetical protein
MAICNNRGVNLVAPEHFKRLALGVVIDAGEPRANERISAGHALHEPTPGAHLHEITGCRYGRAISLA